MFALAAGIGIGAGLEASTRAMLFTLGHVEMVRPVVAPDARAGTLSGLSVLGDRVPTCTSDRSRSFPAGLAMGPDQPVDLSAAVEGLATARAAARLAAQLDVDVPVMAMVATVTGRALPLNRATAGLMSRPLRKE